MQAPSTSGGETVKLPGPTQQTRVPSSSPGAVSLGRSRPAPQRVIPQDAALPVKQAAAISRGISRVRSGLSAIDESKGNQEYITAMTTVQDALDRGDPDEIRTAYDQAVQGATSVHGRAKIREREPLITARINRAAASREEEITRAQEKAALDKAKVTFSGSVTSAVNEGREEDAIDAVNIGEEAGALSPLQALKLRQEIPVKIAVNSAEETILTASAATLGQMIERLRSPEYNGKLPVGKRLSLAQSAERRLSQLQTSVRGGVSERTRQSEKGITDLTAALNRGLNVPDRDAVIQENLPHVQDEAKLEKLNQALYFNSTANKLRMMPATQREDMLRKLDEQATTPLQAITLDKLRKVHADVTTELKRDMLATADQSGVIALAPLDLTPSGFRESLQQRKRAHDAAVGVYGVSQGLLTQGEVLPITTHLAESDPGQQVRFFNAVKGAIGSDGAELFFQKVKAPSIAAAARVHNFVGPGVAQDMVQGHEYRQAHPEIIDDRRYSFLPEIFDSLGTALVTNPDLQAQVVEGTLDLYAQRASQDPSLLSSGVDTSLLQETVDTITGGVIEYNDYKVIPPVHGMSEALFEQWIEELSPEYFVEKVPGWSSKEVLRGIQKGDLQLVATENRGQYFVKVANTPRYLSIGGGEAFVFEYSPDAPKKGVDPSVEMEAGYRPWPGYK